MTTWRAGAVQGGGLSWPALYGFTAAALSTLEAILEARPGAIAEHYLRILLDDLIDAVKKEPRRRRGGRASWRRL